MPTDKNVVPLLTNKAIKTISRDIVDILFINGFNESANRLILELDDKRNGGGWCKEAATKRIEEYLLNTRPEKNKGKPQS